jgi:oligogalacturonide lyase
MKLNQCLTISFLFSAAITLSTSVFSQIGKRFPSEKKVIKDPVTGVTLSFLTSKPMGDSKIYQTHNQWTSDGEWLIFRSSRVRGEAMAVNEKSGEMVQVTEGGYTGMLNIARKSMKLYFMRNIGGNRGADTTLSSFQPTGRPVEVVEVDLGKLFEDSKAGKPGPATSYQRICGTTPAELGAGGDMALDGDEEWVYFRAGKTEAAKHLSPGTKLESNFGPRNMGAGPSGLAAMNIKTGAIKYVVSVPFQVGHIQTNPWVPGEIVFCWETGGKSPQRTWTVMSDGTGLRPLYPESEYEWVTHEAVISKDEVAIALMGHRKINFNSGTGATVNAQTVSTTQNPGQEAAWGPSGTREKPTGLGIVNLRTREMKIVGQTPSGSGLWHVHGSSDGRWAVGDDFSRSLYLIDRHTGEMIMLTTGHKATAADHPHPTFSPDGTRIEIQSAMLSEDNRSMNICIVNVPDSWLKRKY